MARKPRHQPGLPTREQILEFIEESKEPAGKREIARAFGLHGSDKIALKALLKDMTDEGLIDAAPGRAFHKMGGVPRVTVLKIVDVDGNQLIAIPERWEADGIPLPKLRVVERGRKGALGIGDRILARTEEAGKGWLAHPMKKLAKASEQIMGVVEESDNGRFWLKSTDKKARFDIPLFEIGEAQPGDLVLAELGGRAGQKKARVTDVLGDPFAPRSFSLIAIHKFGIPFEIPEEVEAEAKKVHDLPVTAEKREDLRHLPIIAIDPRDARDFDDAVWATPDDDPKNTNGFKAIVAIADVSYYVRPGSALDREAAKRGNSVYFPDRVVPMLPHALSSDKCSLREGEDRAVLACHMQIDAGGQVTSWRFTRAVARISANIPYQDAQDAIDGKLDHPMLEPALKPLWACCDLLKKARDRRGPLELNLPERRITLDEQGRVVGVAVREHLDAHQVIEDFMIAANVAAAKALEEKKSPLIYRVHEPPAREKLVALKDYLKTFDLEFALGQVVRPSTFNAIIDKVQEHDEILPQIMEAVLRSQTQAYYTPQNAGHFGLALGSYAHFTSPIRRYADLIVHRALVSAYDLEMPVPKDGSIKPVTGLSARDFERLDVTSEMISRAERRAMEAERETTDRYVAAFLSSQIGQIIDARITGVQNFGFFATVESIGGDGLVPVSTLGAERFFYDEASQTLTGEDSGDEYRPGMRLKLRLAEANPVSGALRFELPEGGSYAPARMQRPSGVKHQGKHMAGKRGRPSNIRHQGKKKR
ncbi:ribonuclease R [Sphingorhabdus sp.]|uniref:ribonuclease R n=1 Tax=Sphingorhabdus sp. TaxID=1902408 RepID=UPI002CFD45B4|nr:ribonuclease R [Sphingorhabdus sp.]HMT41753.1 ribonuclease R [Sphingorhabdus sp.]